MPGRACRPNCPIWETVRPCSCGHTGTAPTRCSSPCCAAPADRPTSDSDDRATGADPEDMTGSTARRWLLGLVVAVGAVVVPAAPALASQAPGPVSLQRAPNDPPDVHGLSVADTRKVLQSWNKGVVIIFDPDLRQLPQGATEANLVEVRDALVQASTPQELKEFSAAGPRVLVTLGAVMPDLKGLDAQKARAVLADRGLGLDPTPDRPSSDWVVTGQAYPPGSLVEFRVPVPAAFGPPGAPPPPPQRDQTTGLPVWLLVAIGLGA